MQRLAAQLIRDCHGLDHAHPGTVCDALTAAGIDPTVWSARAISERLNADMRDRGSSWPDRIERPGAFLASRLRRHDWRQLDESPKGGGGCAAAGPERPAVTVPPATPEQRAAHRARIAATISAARRARSELDGLVEHDPIHVAVNNRLRAVHQPRQRRDGDRRSLGDQHQQKRRLEIHEPR